MKYNSYKPFRWHLLTISLFLICMLQIMIFGFFQTADHLISLENESKIIPLNVMFYLTMLITSVFHPFIMRKFSLKFALLAGLVSDFLAVSLLWMNEVLGSSFILIALAFFLAGISIVSVVNCLVTYLVIEFPSSLGFAMIALFLFANAGMFVQTFLYDLVKDRSFYPFFCVLAFVCLLVAMIYVQIRFFNPEAPPRLEHLRRSSLIWKELHYRMGLFILLMISYGIVESFFCVWGSVYLLQFGNEMYVQRMITVFWSCMISGQIILLAPIYFFPARKIFSLLVLFTIGVTFFLERQTHTTGILLGYMGVGIGCSIIFPVLLAFFEREILQTCSKSKIHSPIPFIETGISLMIGGYLAGVGLVSLFVLKHQHHLEVFDQNSFDWAVLFLAAIGITSTYLNWSSK